MSLLSDNREKADLIIADIESQLRNRESFGRVMLSDRGNKFSVNGFLTVVPSFVYIGVDVTEDDLDDPKAVADDFVSEWCKNDGASDVRKFQQFVSLM